MKYQNNDDLVMNVSSSFVYVKLRQIKQIKGKWVTCITNHISNKNNTVSKPKTTKIQTTVYKSLYRKQKVEQQEPHQKSWRNMVHLKDKQFLLHKWHISQYV